MPNSTGEPGRATMSPAEVKGVLALFELPTVASVHEFRKGSSRLAKAVVQSRSGEAFILKRRGGSTEDLARIAYAHDVQVTLYSRHFPVPRLIRTHEGGTWVEWDGQIYELFEFVEGERYRRSVGEARESGLFLSRLHRTLKGWSSKAAPPAPGGYHRSKTVAASWSRVASRVALASKSEAALFNDRILDLERQYAAAGDAAARGVEGGSAAERDSVIHGDFHPGNLLFVSGSPVVMIDFDAVRKALPLIDVANGALQFGMHPVGDKPVSEWVPTLNLSAVEAFLRGYALSEPMRLTQPECAAVPSLMIEAAIAECIPRLALNGTFAKRPGGDVLAFLRSKTAWIWDERDRIATLCVACMSGR